jgi:hypothetical protein
MCDHPKIELDQYIVCVKCQAKWPKKDRRRSFG